MGDTTEITIPKLARGLTPTGDPISDARIPDPLIRTIQIRNGTATSLASVVLAAAQPGYATDTKKFTIGDGSTTFANLRQYNSDIQTITVSSGTVVTLPISSADCVTYVIHDTRVGDTGAGLEIDLPTAHHAGQRVSVLLAYNGAATHGYLFTNAITLFYRDVAQAIQRIDPINSNNYTGRDFISLDYVVLSTTLDSAFITNTSLADSDLGDNWQANNG